MRHGFLIADAGGGTLDISAYAIRASSPLVMEEIAPPDCMSLSFPFHQKLAELICASRHIRGFRFRQSASTRVPRRFVFSLPLSLRLLYDVHSFDP